MIIIGHISERANIICYPNYVEHEFLLKLTPSLLIMKGQVLQVGNPEGTLTHHLHLSTERREECYRDLEVESA